MASFPGCPTQNSTKCWFANEDSLQFSTPNGRGRKITDPERERERALHFSRFAKVKIKRRPHQVSSFFFC